MKTKKNTLKTEVEKDKTLFCDLLNFCMYKKPVKCHHEGDE